ncbi:MAG: hypothetical protein M0R17_02230 [Candidatus Omnitrophica bacterium]|jgi:hypothetical protein|nr:hypothetical protein [Candidatus Omnitrophota bacterium]
MAGIYKNATDYSDIPEQISIGQKVVSVMLADGKMAVKISKTNNLEDQLYGIHSAGGKYLGELLTIDEVK